MNLNLNNLLIERDLATFWHPCSQMKDFETFKPLPIRRAEGCYIEPIEGEPIIDAISSWWCKSLGHSEVRLKTALMKQLEQFEHVMLANFTHEAIITLSEKLTHLTGTLNKVLYASDGSCAVEMAMKLSLHAKQILGQTHRTQFMALANSYHGETGLALSVSDLGLYRKPYESVLIPCHFLQNIPYVSGTDDPLWHDCSEIWPNIELQLQPHQNNLCALIIEPIVQGSTGMRIYSQDFLRRLSLWAKQHDVYLIADEIMTGLGRTGCALACQHAMIEPDFLCLSKGLTAGFLPLSATLTTDAIYQLFYADFSIEKNFLHSHTHTGNALAAAVAVEVLTILEKDKLYLKTQELEKKLLMRFNLVAEKTKMLTNIRCIGGIVAGDLLVNPKVHPVRLSQAIFQEAIKLGALLRPLGNTLYWFPPFIIDDNTLDKLEDITTRAILNVI